MSENNERRMVSDTGYEIKQAVHIGDKEIVVAENMNEPEGLFYLLANYTDKGLLGEYSQCIYGSDYLGIMQEFTFRINRQIETTREELKTANYQSEPITADQCHPDKNWQSINGKVVAIKAEVLRPEYRRGDRQLVLVDGGNGARGNARGSAVFCYYLYDGKHTRFERYDVQGEIKQLPTWAAERLAEVKTQTAAKREEAKKSREDAR